ncbi:ArsC/Spx/MgsR family protein [Kaistella jeonii]|uniref:Arsenate reductase n=1 Tax=Kaistella jeonii TaxID=266749 RepID=A0A0C1FDJ8_9FLAO|nr:ArsC/Spx/MgsR family protein [Kaistella jeonii]KIA86059.1 arsenate reductase [Kaistella jeonii]SFC34448.1 arsenate reductase [Kaistella jeonii]VEI95311.1 arsenate reductase [Kaistella jeonii]
MIKVLHNNSCSKSRAILEHLDENNVAFEIIDFIEHPLTVVEMKTVLKKLHMSAEELIRKSEPLFKEKFANQTLSEDEWIDVLVENPSLIQRPILIKGEVAMVGRPIENVKYFIDN